MTEFDDMRREAARKTLEDAASVDDPDTARLLEMCADDLTRLMTDHERALVDHLATGWDDKSSV